MTLQEQFEETGSWLFRWRSYFPLIGILILLVAMRDYKHPESQLVDYLYEAFCFIISLLGLGIRAFTVGHTPKHTSGRNTKTQLAASLNTTGIYSVVRNPLYLGNFIIGLGLVLTAQSLWLILIYSLAFWLYYERIIFAEEVFLKHKFGDEYVRWARITPAFIPNLKGYKRADLSFSWKNVLKREYNAFFLIIVGGFFMEIIGDLFSKGKIDFEMPWLIIVCVGFTIWMTLRTLKKYTSILRVAGR